jgi:WD40 repeat protein
MAPSFDKIDNEADDDPTAIDSQGDRIASRHIPQLGIGWIVSGRGKRERKRRDLGYGYRQEDQEHDWASRKSFTLLFLRLSHPEFQVHLDFYLHQARVPSLSWNGSVVSSGCRDGSIWHHDVRVQNHKVQELRGHNAEVCGLAWRGDGQFLASGGNDNIVNCWE